MKNKFDIADYYSMEELVPIVAELAAAYTGNESTSVTYEKARQLMEAIIYCIRHFYEKNSNSLISAEHILAEEAYRLGYEEVISKVRNTQEKYNRLTDFFCHYGNENYRDTVLKALPGFFLYYDPRFAPTERIITMDYPIIGIDMELEGIDIIAEYIDKIWEEQVFLQRFPYDYVVDELRSFHPRYEREFFNLREVVELQLK